MLLNERIDVAFSAQCIRSGVNMETQRVVVTGCSGFLGRYVVKDLTRKGHEVVGFDIVQPNYPIPAFKKGDFTKKDVALNAIRGASVVCHLGGVGDVYLADSDPVLAFKANAYGTKVICDVSRDLAVAKLVYASTWEVYGSPQRIPVDEMHPCSPESPYSISKLAGELFVRHLRASQAVESIALRLGTAYGEGMRETAVIARFLTRARQGKALSIHGNGDQYRQFTHADDIANAFSLVVGSPTSSGIFNIIAEQKTTIVDLARLIAARFEVSLEFEKSRVADPPSALITSRLAKQELGWVPNVLFVDGIQRLIEARGA